MFRKSEAPELTRKSFAHRFGTRLALSFIRRWRAARRLRSIRSLAVKRDPATSASLARPTEHALRSNRSRLVCNPAIASIVRGDQARATSYGWLHAQHRSQVREARGSDFSHGTPSSTSWRMCLSSRLLVGVNRISPTVSGSTRVTGGRGPRSVGRVVDRLRFAGHRSRARALTTTGRSSVLVRARATAAPVAVASDSPVIACSRSSSGSHVGEGYRADARQKTRGAPRALMSRARRGPPHVEAGNAKIGALLAATTDRAWRDGHTPSSSAQIISRPLKPRFEQSQIRSSDARHRSPQATASTCAKPGRPLGRKGKRRRPPALRSGQPRHRSTVDPRHADPHKVCERAERRRPLGQRVASAAASVRRGVEPISTLGAPGFAQPDGRRALIPQVPRATQRQVDRLTASSHIVALRLAPHQWSDSARAIPAPDRRRWPMRSRAEGFRRAWWIGSGRRCRPLRYPNAEDAPTPASRERGRV